MLKELIFNKKNIKYLNFLILIFIFIYMAYKLRYAIVSWDDMLDILVDSYSFYHGRFFTELFNILMIKTIPETLNIPIQNFAFVSEGLTKAGLFTFVIFIIGKCFSGHDENLNKYNFLLYILSCFIIFSFIVPTGDNTIYSTMQFFSGFIVPFIFFIPLWLKISDYYVEKKSPTKKDIFILCILALLTGTGNEIVAAVTLILLSILLIENIILKIKDKNVKINGYIYYPLIICLMSAYTAYKSVGTQALINAWNISIYYNIETIPIFLRMLINIVFIKNLFLWIPSIICLTIIKFLSIENKNRIVKYFIYTYVGILLFSISLYFLGETFPYIYYNHYLYAKFWILYSMILLNIQIILYSLLLYLIGKILIQKNSKSKKVILLILILVPCLIFIFNNYKNRNFSDINKKKSIYISDKLAVFYYTHGYETAILPAETTNNILSVWNDNIPMNIKNNNYEGKKYIIEKYPLYVRYILKYYHIVKTENNIPLDYTVKIKPIDEALNDFYKNGGVLTQDELDKLDFSLIEKQDINNINGLGD